MTMLNPQLKMIQQQNAFLIYNLHCSFILGMGKKLALLHILKYFYKSHYAKSLDFVQKISPFKADLSGNTVWPQD